MRRFDGSSVAALLICVLIGSPLSRAQSTAELRGKVTDSSHHPVVSAFIIVTGQDASQIRAATTDDSGEFEFASLPIGTYQLQVKADDFLTFDASGIRASIGQVITLDVVLSRKGGSGGSTYSAATNLTKVCGDPHGSSGFINSGSTSFAVFWAGE